MIKKLTQKGYHILAIYFLVGIITTILTFLFVQQFLLTDSFTLTQMSRESRVLLIASFIGAVVGGLFYLVMIVNSSKQQDADTHLWNFYKTKGLKGLLMSNIISFAFAGFIGLLVKNIVDHFDLSLLFTKPNNINYTAIIIAGVVFGIFLSFGQVKRLKYLFID